MYLYDETLGPQWQDAARIPHGQDPPKNWNSEWLVIAIRMIAKCNPIAIQRTVLDGGFGDVWGQGSDTAHVILRHPTGIMTTTVHLNRTRKSDDVDYPNRFWWVAALERAAMWGKDKEYWPGLGDSQGIIKEGNVEDALKMITQKEAIMVNKDTKDQFWERMKHANESPIIVKTGDTGSGNSLQSFRYYGIMTFDGDGPDPQTKVTVVDAMSTEPFEVHFDNLYNNAASAYHLEDFAPVT
ncbi:hypothetical protein IAU60_003451 [Kwoniella sp. DSM 27419]